MPDRERPAGDDQSPAGIGYPSGRPESDVGAATPPPAPGDATAASSPKFCPHCGNEYDSALNFCPRDGNILQVRHGQHDLVGQVLGQHYRILEPLGEGGMGQVFLAEHVRIGRRCAIKVMRPALVRDPGAVGRFGREAKTAGRINHRNAAAIYDFGETPEGLIYIVMEHVEGPPLSQILAREGVLSPARAIEIALQLCDALAAAHHLGIIHRDLKPDNILIAREEDGRDLVKVVDFGIAKAMNDAEHSFTRTGFVLGTLQYMSPEQLIGESLDGRSDLYSVGCILFEMLTGERTFAGPSGPAAVARRLTEAPPSPRTRNPSIPADLDALVTRALARTPAERFQSAEELRAALKQVLGSGPTVEIATGAAPLPPAAVALTPGHMLPAAVPSSTAAGVVPVAPATSAPALVAAPSQATPATPAPVPAATVAASAAAGVTAAAAPSSGLTAHGAPPPPRPDASGALAPRLAAAPASGPTPASGQVRASAPRRLRLAALAALVVGFAAFAAVLHWKRAPAASAPRGARVAAATNAAAPVTPTQATTTPTATASGPRSRRESARPPAGAPTAGRPGAPAPAAAAAAPPAAAARPALMRVQGRLPAGAMILLDGSAVHRRELLVPPGRHTLQVFAPGFESFQWSGALAEGDRKAWVVSLKAVASAPTTAAAAPQAAAPTPAAPAPPLATAAPSTSAAGPNPVTPRASAGATLPGPTPAGTQPAPPEQPNESTRAFPMLAVDARRAAQDLAAAIRARDAASLRRAWPGITPEVERRWQTFLASGDNGDIQANVASLGAPQADLGIGQVPFALRVSFSNRVSGRNSAVSRFVAIFQGSDSAWKLIGIRAEP